MIFTIIAILLIAAVILPLIRQDLKKAVIRQRYRKLLSKLPRPEVFVEFKFNMRQFVMSMEQASKAIEKFGEELRKKMEEARK